MEHMGIGINNQYTFGKLTLLLNIAIYSWFTH